jgi:hypothetical protein
MSGKLKQAEEEKRDVSFCYMDMICFYLDRPRHWSELGRIVDADEEGCWVKGMTNPSGTAELTAAIGR